MLRHQARTPTSEEPVTSDGGEAVSSYLAPYLGEAQTVFHEIVSDRIHLDVHIVAPTPQRPSYVLYTTGMSDIPMRTPLEGRGAEYAELLISLPATWPMPAGFAGAPSEGEEASYWPIGQLKFLARLPHDYRTWLGTGHTVPNGDPARPFADDTRLCCWWILPARQLPEAARVGTLSDRRRVHFYSVHALYRSEMDFKLKQGGQALRERYEQRGESEGARSPAPRLRPERVLRPVLTFN